MLIPNGDRLLIEEIKQETTAGGILKPANDDKPKKGKVIASGEGYWLSNGTFVSNNILEQEIVIYPNFSGTKIIDEDSGKEYILISERDILCKVKEK